ncbi:response regulator transcription factor [Streptomyces zaomyceticus]|uniref:response regulator transcription factor n=1 Tax=Streptomyces zaomyceticus TaxID=68286 RepID=UPI003435EBF9
MQDVAPDPFGGVRGGGSTGALRVVVADDNPVVRAGLRFLLSGRDVVVVAEAVDGRSAWEATLEHRPDAVLLDVRMPGVDGLSALPHLVGMAPVVMLSYSAEVETVQEAVSRGARGFLVYGEFTADQLVAAIHDSRGRKAHVTPTAAGALLDGLREGGRAREVESLTESGGGAEGGWDGVSEGALGVFAASRGGAHGMLPAHPVVVDRARFDLSAREAEIMDLIAAGMTNQRIAATCFIAEKTVKNHINRIFAKLHSTRRAEAVAKWLGTAPGATPR